MREYSSISYIGNKWPTDYQSPYLTRNPEKWLTKETRLFAIGSCFAVNLGRWITQHGVPIVSPEWGLHYNSSTIKEELSSAAGKSKASVIWKASTDSGVRYFDAGRHPVAANSEEELKSLITAIEAAGREGMIEADAFVVTLGLSEVWEQKVGDEWRILNRAPLSSLDRENYNFRNRFQTAEEIKNDLHAIVDLINSASDYKRPVVITVSPVPLKTTGAGFDPRIANTRSKSNIVAAVHQFLDEIEEEGGHQVSYFPAYEMFQYIAAEDNCWQSDGRHVTAEKVNYVCKQFTNIFAQDEKEFPTIKGFEVPRV
ncbi:GSCFA domain-containing protein [Hahella aquimaris]|uniref:GSCFA domain-containing protein n=1 Tax=Hahella sp. HNIBRBA332 TaxID=3015983 RepID=UPI00273B83C0|nr:GSCFA domain-containing protein [Hahella sp. HNIBRBA332]WLQ15963.1 GSCFA domain-containing protein [Hahella sp. HNIBRBA332]